MFHFGDVSVSNHPAELTPVPMVIPMVYLLPEDNGNNSQEVRYRMFIPLGSGNGPSLPPFPPPLLPQPIPGLKSPPQPPAQAVRKRKASNCEGGVQKKDQSPLDLSKSPLGAGNGNPDDAEADDINANNKSEEPKSDIQRELEAHFNFLKGKHMELMRAQQNPIESRCEECNINFSRHQNFVAHKKYYCSAGANQPQPQPPAKSKTPQPIIVDVGGSASAEVKKSVSPGSAGQKSPTKALLGIGSPPLPPKTPTGSPNVAAAAALALGKEMLLLKQQQTDFLLKNSDLCHPAPPLLLPAPHPPQRTSMTSPKAEGNSSATSPVSKSATSHFSCEGCGIKFKSMSNLQAHQARYCAGLRGAANNANNAKREVESALEAMIQRGPPPPPPPPPPQLQPKGQMPMSMLTSAAEMMNFINAKSMEHQAKLAAAAAAAAAAAGGPLPLQEKTDGGIKLANGDPSTNGDDFCCILCGYKEQSVERLKDHINMHFIGQVAKKPPPAITTAAAPKQLKPTSSSSTSSEESKQEVSRSTNRNLTSLILKLCLVRSLIPHRPLLKSECCG